MGNLLIRAVVVVVGLSGLQLLGCASTPMHQPLLQKRDGALTVKQCDSQYDHCVWRAERQDRRWHSAEECGQRRRSCYLQVANQGASGETP